MNDLNTPPPSEEQFTVVPPVKPEFSPNIPPLPVGTYYTPIPQTRPTAALVIGIVSFVYAAFALFGIIGSLIDLVSPMSATMINKSYFEVKIMDGVVGSVFYLVMGIGLIKVIPWARLGAIATFVMMTLIGSVMNSYGMATMHMPDLSASPLWCRYISGYTSRQFCCGFTVRRRRLHNACLFSYSAQYGESI